MHSKEVIWDLFNKMMSNNFQMGKHYQFVSNELIYLDLVKKIIKHKGTYRTVFAGDLTLEWFENNVFGLSLFGNENYIILESEKLSKNIIDRILNSFNLIDATLIFMGSKKLDFGEDLNLTEIVAPNFWELDKLLDFFLKIKKVQITFEAQQYILDSIEATPAGFYQIAMNLQNFYPGQLVDIVKLQNILEKSKLDKFEFSKLLSQKRLGDFFQKLITIKTDTKTLRSFFLFMQTHLFKVCDPSYVEKKKKLSKYDREILEAAKIWKPGELDKVMDELRQLEQTSKIDADNLLIQLQQFALQYQGNSPVCHS